MPARNFEFELELLHPREILLPCRRKDRGARPSGIGVHEEGQDIVLVEGEKGKKKQMKPPFSGIQTTEASTKPPLHTNKDTAKLCWSFRADVRVPIE